MNRCLDHLNHPPPTSRSSRARASIFAPAAAWRFLIPALVLSALPWVSAQAQATRNFPDSALRAKMVVVQPPEITLNGEPARLSPGSRIRSQTNMLVLSGSLVGQAVTVNYVRDGQGLVHEVWMLTEAEAAQKRAGAATERNYRSGADTPVNPNAPARPN
ncbi:MAG TPA: hypothetical protein VFY22_08735 [Hydrogenophaga sp.]|nr:hypothetical protein [Hydrogenophaga sp.]